MTRDGWTGAPPAKMGSVILMNARKWLLAVTAIAVILLANLLVAEFAVGVYYRLTKGSFIWTRTVAASSAPAAAAADDPVKTKMTLNPYFGDNTLAGVRFRGLWPDEFYKERITGLDYLPSYYDRLTVNNHGFWSLHEYPYQPKDDEFVVGVFGGSVAFHFWLSTLDERSPTLKKFAAATGKKVVFLNFASGGRKQPQSMLQLAYYMSRGQKFDFVLNIDGFNEVYAGWINVKTYDVDYSMPFAEFAYKIQNAFLERAFNAGDTQAGSLIDRRDTWERRAATTRSSLVYYLSDLMRRRYISAIVDVEKRLADRKNLRYPVQLVPAASNNFDEVIPRIAALWFNSSVAMSRMTAPAGIPYLHVLQPNQYFSKKVLSSKETEWAVRGAPTVPLAQVVPQAYEAFLAYSPKLAAQGVAFVDATPIYDAVADTIFVDWCCHVNERGNAAVGDLIEAKMIEMLKPRN